MGRLLRVMLFENPHDCKVLLDGTDITKELGLRAIRADADPTKPTQVELHVTADVEVVLEHFTAEEVLIVGPNKEPDLAAEEHRLKRGDVWTKDGFTWFEVGENDGQG